MVAKNKMILCQSFIWYLNLRGEIILILFSTPNIVSEIGGCESPYRQIMSEL